LSAATIVIALLSLAAPAAAEWKVASEDGSSFIKLGFLAQGQIEWADNSADTEYVSQNIYMRRFRIMAGGQIGDKITFFFETDQPNMGKCDPVTGRKIQGSMFMQDVIMTYKVSDMLLIDGGMLLIPASHNSTQGAVSLLPIDYGPYSFLGSAPTQSVVGRDYGVQARGYLLNNKIEYRVGVFQGARDLDTPDTNADAPFRYAGRVVLNLGEDAETGFFYAGTYFGKKKIFSLGASADLQDSYQSYGGDLFIDQPVGAGAVTLQANYMYYDGQDAFPDLEAQNDWLVELGLYNGSSKLGFYSQVAMQDFVQEKFQDEDRYQAGLVYWGMNHNFNIKAGYTVIHRDHTEFAPHSYRDMYVIQSQVMMY
jgi:hypothetical protein